MRLYEIVAEIDALMRDAETQMMETGEISDALAHDLDTLDMERTAKMEACAYAILSMDAEAEALATESARLRKRGLATKASADRLREYVLKYVPAGGVDVGVFRLLRRENKAVKVNIDAEYLPDMLRRVEYVADKTAIKKRILSGEFVQGCEIVTNVSLQVK